MLERKDTHREKEDRNQGGVAKDRSDTEEVAGVWRTKVGSSWRRDALSCD